MTINPVLLAKLKDLPDNVRARIRSEYQKMQSWAGELRQVDTKHDGEGWHVTMIFEYGTIDTLIPDNDKRPGG